jgi:hypothetical protein
MGLSRAELNHFQGRTRQCLELLAELLAYVNSMNHFFHERHNIYSNMLFFAVAQMATVRPPTSATTSNDSKATPPSSPPSMVEYATWRERAKIIQLRMASFHLHEPDYATGMFHAFLIIFILLSF